MSQEPTYSPLFNVARVRKMIGHARACENHFEGRPDDDYVEIRISASRLAVMSDTVASARHAWRWAERRPQALASGQASGAAV